MRYLIFAAVGYLAGSLLFERLLEGKEDKKTAAAWILSGLMGFLPVFAAGFFLDKGHPGFILTILAPAFGHSRSLFWRGGGERILATSLGSLLGLMPVWQPFAALAVSAALFFLAVEISPYIFRILAVFLLPAAICFLFLGPEVISWGCVFLAYLAASRELEGYRGERLTVRLVSRRGEKSG